MFFFCAQDKFSFGSSMLPNKPSSPVLDIVMWQKENKTTIKSD
jgi:hypothetical protein